MNEQEGHIRIGTTYTLHGTGVGLHVDHVAHSYLLLLEVVEQRGIELQLPRKDHYIHLPTEQDNGWLGTYETFLRRRIQG